jgi:polysaccharide export outer membrane protein
MMKKALLIMGLFLCLPFVSIAADANYIIGESDSLDISIWGEQNLSRQITVRPDGLISLPLIGEIKADRKHTVNCRWKFNRLFPNS